MTNKLGDYACFTFDNYDNYIKCYNRYYNIGWI
jgi:hypothetical protein